jgi:hypothetical protein
VQGAGPHVEADRERQRELVGAFLAASRGGEIRGREAVAETFKGRAQAAQPALIEGETGLVFAPGGVPRVVFDLVIEQDRIIEINLIADPAHIAALDVRMGA